MRSKDISGMRFGMLTATEYKGTNKHRFALWFCVCDCGNSVVATGNALRKGHTRSCGCLQKKAAAKSISAFNGSGKRSSGRLAHGENKTPLHNAWLRMRRRCSDTSYEHYNRYGGRGISVCKEWESYTAFRDWALSHGYKEGLELDRIDNNGNYEPSNCRWATRTAQMRNRSNTIYVELNGERKPLVEFCEIYGVNYKTAHAKHKKGIPPEKIFIETKLKTTP